MYRALTARQLGALMVVVMGNLRGPRWYFDHAVGIKKHLHDPLGPWVLASPQAHFDEIIPCLPSAIFLCLGLSL